MRAHNMKKRKWESRERGRRRDRGMHDVNVRTVSITMIIRKRADAKAARARGH